MLDLNAPQKLWGIAHGTTELIGRLWCDKLFVFQSHAQQEVDRVSELMQEDGGTGVPLTPVLLDVTVTLCGAEETAAYAAGQEAWLAQKGQAAKRRREQERGAAGEPADSDPLE